MQRRAVPAGVHEGGCTQAGPGRFRLAVRILRTRGAMWLAWAPRAIGMQWHWQRQSQGSGCAEQYGEQ